MSKQGISLLAEQLQSFHGKHYIMELSSAT